MAKDSDITNLKPAHQIFINQYINTSNLVQSYLKAYPNASYQVASNNASKLLEKDYIKQALQVKLNDLNENSIHERKSLLKRAYNYEVKADGNKKWQICCNLLDLQAKLAGHYKDTDSNQANFNVLLNQITVNTGKQEENKVYDVDSIDSTDSIE